MSLKFCSQHLKLCKTRCPEAYFSLEMGDIQRVLLVQPFLNVLSRSPQIKL